MGEYTHPDVLDDASLVWRTGDRIVACSAQPTTYTEAVSTYALGAADLTVGAGNGDYTVTTDGNDRVMTLAAHGTTGSGTGTANHVAIVDTANSKLLLVHPVSNKSIVKDAAFIFGSITMRISRVAAA